MKVFNLKLPTNLEEMVNNFTSPELKEAFAMLIEAEDELNSFLNDIANKKSDLYLYVKLVGFSEEEKILLDYKEENPIEIVSNSLVRLVKNLLRYNNQVLYHLEDKDYLIFPVDISSVKICIDLD